MHFAGLTRVDLLKHPKNINFIILKNQKFFNCCFENNIKILYSSMLEFMGIVNLNM